VISGVPVKGGGGDGGSASFEQEKRNTTNANVSCINNAFLNELEELMFILIDFLYSQQLKTKNCLSVYNFGRFSLTANVLALCEGGDFQH
jgi:hypothetical protein